MPTLPLAGQPGRPALEIGGNRSEDPRHTQATGHSTLGRGGSLFRRATADYDTSLKFYRKVYKDCLLSFNANRYYVPPEVVGKKVLLKVKGNQLWIYHDDTLLKQYQIPDQM